MRTIEATPICDRESAPHKRRRGSRHRPYQIEGRYIGPQDNTCIAQILGRDWRLVGSYETERGQLDAFRALTTKGCWWNQNHEYRLKAEAAK